ncbi:MAG: TIGR02757 family protein [Chitinophagaceae bacterium]|nr:TIGR02757 family protein [Chitinophagaceae bacterium]
MKQKEIKILLDKKVDQYNQPFFIAEDPISIPHRFAQQQDIEIAGFFAAILAWGNRKSIINSCNKLMQWMNNQPYQFCLHHSQKDLQQLLNFKHRTYNTTDLLYCIAFFKQHYSINNSLESAFTKWMNKKDETVENGLIGFHNYFFSLPDFPERTRKHIATPQKKSACKRLNMYLRWMVRSNITGVDFGLWNSIKPSQLICPLDVHVSRVAKKLGILNRKQNDWQAAMELTSYLKTLDACDPVKYDFALFGLGVVEKF